MAMYVSLIQFTDQGIRNVKDTVKRGDAAIGEAEKMGIKIIEEFWAMGAVRCRRPVRRAGRRDHDRFLG